MTVAFVINLRPKAFADIRRNVGWLATHFSAAKATRWQQRANSSIRSLENDPNRCALAEEASDVGVDLRELIFGRGRHVFRVLFTIDGETVSVHRVRHAAQDRLTDAEL